MFSVPMAQLLGWDFIDIFISPQLPSWGGAISPILQMRKLRPTEVNRQIAPAGNMGAKS